MSQYAPALQYLLNFEDPDRTYLESMDNNGGKVIAGINARSFPQAEGEIAALPQAQRAAAVAGFYLKTFWNPLKCGALDAQDVADRVLDMGVDGGMYEAQLLLQRAINAIHPGTLVVDGDIGPATLEAANGTDPEALLAAYRTERVAFYEQLVAQDPQRYNRYKAGWIRRAQA